MTCLGHDGGSPKGRQRKIYRWGNGKIDYCADVLTIEALALKLDLSLAQRRGCNHLIINNLDVIDTMKDGGWSAGMAAAILF